MKVKYRKILEKLMDRLVGKRIVLFIITTGMLVVNNVYSQNCGCALFENCPEIIESGVSGYSICYELEDIMLDDLSDPAQGICGVSVNFSHDYIWDLEMSLVSPAGQSVMLVGPAVTSSAGGTNLTSWEVDFVPCSEIAAPEPGFLSVWNNDQSWPFIGSIGGSYYPVTGGCLEDFDVGSINGPWCIVVDNPSFASGEILDFSVSVCNHSGILCCEADGGVLNDIFVFCESEIDTLPLIVEGNDMLDTMVYGYTYLLVGADGTILEVDSLMDVSGLNPGIYQMCGLSYLRDEMGLLPVADGALTITNVEDNLSGMDPSFCGNLSEGCATLEVLMQIDDVGLLDSICSGEVYQIGNETYDTAGIYEIELVSYLGCDSTVILDLLVLPENVVNLDLTICEGDELLVADTIISTSGIYEVRVEDVAFCDSIYVVEVEVFEEVIYDISATICNGEAYGVGSEFYSVSGMYSDTLMSWRGCDSIVNLDLEVIFIEAILEEPLVINCDVSTVVLDGTSSIWNMNSTYVWLGLDGQDVSNEITDFELSINEPGEYWLVLEEGNCRDTAVVDVLEDVELPSVDAGDDVQLDCQNQNVLLVGTESGIGTNIEYEWSSVDGLVPIGQGENIEIEVDIGNAFYYLEVTNTDNHCVSVDSVYVALDTLRPEVIINTPNELNCASQSVMLNASGSLILPSYNGEWTNIEGEPLLQSDPGIIEVFEPGWYFYSLIDNGNLCEAIDSISVEIDTIHPQLNFDIPDVISCEIDSVFLTYELMDVSSYNLLWQGPGEVFDELSVLPYVNQAGVYSLYVVSQDNFCEVENGIEVLIDTMPPIVEAGLPQIITCLDGEVSVGDVNSTATGTDILYQWFFNGALVGSNIPLIVEESGSYMLEVTNTVTGCTSKDSVSVAIDTLSPVVEISDPNVLNCVVDVTSLNGQDNEQHYLGNDVVYSWYDEEENLIADNVDMISVTQSGIYSLQIEYLPTACISNQEVEVFSDTEIPIADAGFNQNLNCDTGLALLNGSNSDLGLEYLWADGNYVEIENSDVLQIEVSEIGVYYLQVTNPETMCTMIDSVFVSIDELDCLPEIVLSPGVEIFGNGVNGIIDCNTLDSTLIEGQYYLHDTIEVLGLELDSPHIQYQWSTSNGQIIDVSNPFFPILSIGIFTLTGTHSLLNITKSVSIEIIDIRDYPFADAGFDSEIDCNNHDIGITLNGTNSDQGFQFSYLWSTLDGDFQDSDINSINPSVFTQGIYQIQVRNNSNGCSSIDFTEVFLNTSPPSVCIEDIVFIDCEDTEITIGDTCPQDYYTYSWANLQGGNIVSNSSSSAQIQVELQPNFNEATFEVMALNQNNQCSEIHTVLVSLSKACVPECIIENNIYTLDCNQPNLNLDASNSSQGTEYTYHWISNPSNLTFCGGELSLTPCVDQAGQYTLVVSNTVNNTQCMSSPITVVDNRQSPDIFIDQSNLPVIGCQAGDIILQAENDDPSLEYFWEETNGACIESNHDLHEIIIACPGTYSLTVTNPITGCFSESSVVIIQDNTTPTVSISTNTTVLDCNTSQILLDGSNSDQGLITWHLDGESILGQISNQITASDAGEYCLTVTNPFSLCSDQFCIEINTENQAVEVTIDQDPHVLNCQTNLLNIPILAPIGNQYTYTWSSINNDESCYSLGNNSSLIVTCPGNYTLTVFDSISNCFGSANVIVQEDTQLPQVVISSETNTLECDNTPILLDANNSDQNLNFQTHWLGPNGEINPDPLSPYLIAINQAGQYSFNIYNPSNFCSNSAIITINPAADAPPIDAGQNQIIDCLSETVTLGTTTSSEPNLSFQWTSLSQILSDPTQAQVTTNQAGTYTLIVTDQTSMCQSTDQVSVTIDTLSPILNIDFTHSNTFDCLTDSLIYNVISNSQNQISWVSDGTISIDPASDFIVNVFPPASFISATLTNPNNHCQTFLEQSIELDYLLPQLNILSVPSFDCQSDQVQVTTISTPPNSSYIWTSPQDHPILGANTPNPTFEQSGTYELHLTNNNNQCHDVFEIFLPIDTISPVHILSTSGQIDCINQEIILLSEPIHTNQINTYQWSGPSIISNPNLQNTIIDQPGVYSLEIINDSNHCVSVHNIEIQTLIEPITFVDLTLLNPPCNNPSGGAITVDTVFGGAGPYTYQLNSLASSSPQFSNLPQGDYTLHVSDPMGCNFTTTTQLSNTEPFNVNLGPDLQLNFGEFITIQSLVSLDQAQIDTVIWSNMPFFDCPNPCLTYPFQADSTTHMTVTVIDDLGCIVSDTIYIRVNRELQEILIPSAFSPNQDGNNDNLVLYFNPNIDIQIHNFQIFDRWGNLHFQTQSQNPKFDPVFWDGKSLNGKITNSGVYILHIEYTSSLEPDKLHVINTDFSLFR